MNVNPSVIEILLRKLKADAVKRVYLKEEN